MRKKLRYCTNNYFYQMKPEVNITIPRELHVYSDSEYIQQIKALEKY